MTDDRASFGLDWQAPGPQTRSMPDRVDPASLTISASEYAALLERVSAAQVSVSASEYAITLEPIRFTIPRRVWERHLIGQLLSRFASGWKGVLTEPTLMVLQARMAALAEPERPRRLPEGGAREPA